MQQLYSVVPTACAWYGPSSSDNHSLKRGRGQPRRCSFPWMLAGFRTDGRTGRSKRLRMSGLFWGVNLGIKLDGPLPAHPAALQGGVRLSISPSLLCQGGTSTTIAEAPPPPLQMPATPIRPPRCLRIATSAPIIRAPEAPIGWPTAPTEGRTGAALDSTG